jgi:hypothetical protein
MDSAAPFFHWRQALLDPVLDGFIVTLDGISGRSLPGPAQLVPQHVPDVPWVVGHASYLLDHLSHTRQGPQVGDTPVGFCALGQCLFDSGELGRRSASASAPRVRRRASRRGQHSSRPCATPRQPDASRPPDEQSLRGSSPARTSPRHASDVPPSLQNRAAAELVWVSTWLESALCFTGTRGVMSQCRTKPRPSGSGHLANYFASLSKLGSGTVSNAHSPWRARDRVEVSSDVRSPPRRTVAAHRIVAL